MQMSSTITWKKVGKCVEKNSHFSQHNCHLCPFYVDQKRGDEQTGKTRRGVNGGQASCAQSFLDVDAALEKNEPWK